MSVKHGKSVCGSVRCSVSACKDAYSRTVKALGVETLGERDYAYVDVVIYVVGGCGHVATLTREDVDSLCDPKWRAKVDTFRIPTANGFMNIITSMITSIEETSRDDY